MNRKTTKSLEVILAEENDQEISTKSLVGVNKRYHPKKWEGLQHGNVKGIKQTEDNAIYGLRQDLTRSERRLRTVITESELKTSPSTRKPTYNLQDSTPGPPYLQEKE